MRFSRMAWMRTGWSYNNRKALEMIVKCSTCHIVKDILSNNTPAEWEKIVNRMVKLAAPQITRRGAADNLLSRDRIPPPIRRSGPTAPFPAR
jgi:hypothetical protein